MGLSDKLLEWLEEAPPPHADLALGAALEHAEPPYFERIVECLLKRGHSSAWSALIAGYEFLSPEVRAQLQSDAELMMSGIAGAMKLGSPASRLNALHAYSEFPTGRLCHLLPYALRDKSSAARERVAEIMRSAADQFLLRDEGGVEGPEEEKRARSEEKRQIVDALREMLRTIDSHLRVEVLEPCLWFAEDLAADFWAALDKPRSRCAHVLAEQLATWNSPRLAGFLLLALTRQDLRRNAQQMLRSWRTPTHTTALLRHTKMLEREEVRHGLLGIRSPGWFQGADSDLSLLPTALRASAPAWVIAAGFTDTEKTTYLDRWTRSSLPEVSQAATAALASMKNRAGPGASAAAPGVSTQSAAPTRVEAVSQKNVVVGQPTSSESGGGKTRATEMKSTDGIPAAKTAPEKAQVGNLAVEPSGSAIDQQRGDTAGEADVVQERRQGASELFQQLLAADNLQTAQHEVLLDQLRSMLRDLHEHANRTAIGRNDTRIER